MSELVFPVAGALVVFLAAVPLATLAAKLVLMAWRRSAGGLVAQGMGGAYALVIAPTLAPALWALSAGLHQSEPGQALAACILETLHQDSCRDALLFTAVLALILGHGLARRLRRDRAPRPGTVQRLAATSRHGRRLAAVCGSHPDLARAARRIAVVAGAPEPVCTRGALRPMIEIDAGFMDRLDDEALTAALLHELEHARALDPLRYLLASVSLSLNPLAWLLRPELARWRLGREAACDRSAVHAGARPLALAAAIVSAAQPARPACPAGAVAGLASAGCDAIKMRVQLLLGYARQPAPPPRRPRISVPPGTAFCVALLVLLILPHATGTSLLDAVHQGVERVLLAPGMMD